MHKHFSKGFTIVELLTVIVAIAILAAIVVVGYGAVTRNAIETSMKSDLKKAATDIGLYRMDNKKFPDSSSDVNDGAGFGVSGDNVVSYIRTGDGYCVQVSSPKLPSVHFSINKDNNDPTEGWCPGLEPIAITSEACFGFNSGYGRLTDYYDHEDNNSSNPPCPKDVGIPESIAGVDVVFIDAFAFQDSQLTSVNIPNTVTYISSMAFRNNQLTTVTIPNSVTTIQNDAFSGNQLTSVALGDSVTSIGAYAFYNNQLTTVTIPNSLTEIGNNSFANNQLTSIVLGNSVTSIGASAFNNNQINSVTIPDSVTVIGNSAFRYNQLTYVTIGNSVASIGTYAFQANQLESVTIPDSVTVIGNYAFRNNQLGSISLPQHLSGLEINSGTLWPFGSNPNPTFTIRP